MDKIHSYLIRFIPVLLAPSAARACSVCFTAEGKSLYAYYAVTAVLTALPFILAGVIYFAVARRSRGE